MNAAVSLVLKTEEFVSQSDRLNYQFKKNHYKYTITVTEFYHI